MADQAQKMAEAAADAILRDLCNRRGLRQQWEGIDGDLQTQIRGIWTGCVLGAQLDEREACAKRLEDMMEVGALPLQSESHRLAWRIAIGAAVAEIRARGGG